MKQQSRPVLRVLGHAALALAWAALFTYCSLIVHGKVMLVCSSIGTVQTECPRVAAGFPLHYLADHPGLSPTGRIAYDPLSLLAGVDLILWPRLALSYLFWLACAAWIAVRRYRLA
jgi:hypothetical protein